jgi:hypothetical protein
MSNKFLGGTSSDLTNGTANLYIASLTVDGLDPSAPLKTNTTKTLQSSNLDIADVNNLQTELNARISNPLGADLDFQTFSAVNKGYDEYNKQAGVSAASAGTLRLYANNDGSLHTVDDAGVDNPIGGGTTSSIQSPDTLNKVETTNALITANYGGTNRIYIDANNTDLYDSNIANVISVNDNYIRVSDGGGARIDIDATDTEMKSPDKNHILRIDDNVSQIIKGGVQRFFIDGISSVLFSPNNTNFFNADNNSLGLYFNNTPRIEGNLNETNLYATNSATRVRLRLGEAAIIGNNVEAFTADGITTTLKNNQTSTQITSTQHTTRASGQRIVDGSSFLTSIYGNNENSILRLGGTAFGLTYTYQNNSRIIANAGGSSMASPDATFRHELDNTKFQIRNSLNGDIHFKVDKTTDTAQVETRGLTNQLKPALVINNRVVAPVAGTGNEIVFNQQDAGGGNANVASIGTLLYDTTAGNMGSHVVIKTADAGGVPVERLRINASALTLFGPSINTDNANLRTINYYNGIGTLQIGNGASTSKVEIGRLGATTELTGTNINAQIGGVPRISVDVSTTRLHNNNILFNDAPNSYRFPATRPAINQLLVDDGNGVGVLDWRGIASLLPPKAYGEQYFVGNALPTAFIGINTYASIVGVRSAGTNSNFQSLPNAIGYTGTTPRTFKVEWHCSAITNGGDNEIYQFAIYKNSVKIPAGEMRSMLDDSNKNYPHNVSSCAMVPLVQNDIIEVLVRNTQSTQGIIVNDLNLVITDAGWV